MGTARVLSSWGSSSTFCEDLLTALWLLTLFVVSVQLLGVVSAEVLENDPADLHALSGVPHPAERSSGSEGRTAGPASLRRTDSESASRVYKVFDMCDLQTYVKIFAK